MLRRDLHPLGEIASVEDALQLVSQLVRVAAEIDGALAFAAASLVDLDEIVAVDGTTEVPPELRLDATEQEILSVLAFVVLVGRAGHPSFCHRRHRAAVDDAVIVQGVGRGDPRLLDHAVGSRDIDVRAFPGPAFLGDRSRDMQGGVNSSSGRSLASGVHSGQRSDVAPRS